MDELKNIFTNFTSLPYLFIGSGMSRRYLDLPDWEGLLKHFISLYSDNHLAFEHYINTAKNELGTLDVKDQNLILPKVASLIENDFNDFWFTSSQFQSNRIKFEKEIKTGVTPFKLEIANYMKELSDPSNLLEEYSHEIKLLQEIADKSINGVITTNYDSLIQDIFKDKDYDCYIGQNDLIFSPVNNIREIYKIHGCYTDPNSIIITHKDYNSFREKGAYMAAKLLTTFVEHPIIFFGYSINDSNIIHILESIIVCLDDDKIEQIKNRLFFVRRNEDIEGIKVNDTIRRFKNASIPMKEIETNDFSLVYEALLDVKAKYNPRILKMLKKDVYNLVVTNDTTKSIIATTDIEDKNLDQLEVVIGVGLKNLAISGIVGISTVDIFKDIIMDDFDFLAMPEFKQEFLVKTLPEQLLRSSYSLPVFKYINDEETIDSKIKDYIEDKIDLDSFLSNTLKDDKDWTENPKTISEVLNRYDDLDTQMVKIAILEKDNIKLDELKLYLYDLITENPEIICDKKHSTNIRRLIKIYDFLKYKK